VLLQRLRKKSIELPGKILPVWKKNQGGAETKSSVEKRGKISCMISIQTQFHPNLFVRQPVPFLVCIHYDTDLGGV
jgi:hypothetical protein